MIQLQNITTAYDKNLVLDQLNLELHAGEIHVVMGHNGAGKTTLTRILAGLEKPDSGQITGHQYLKTMIMQQDFVIWPDLSVSQNMSIASDKATARQWLNKANLNHLEKKKAGNLSHGQKQRLSIARAMAYQPELLIIDEALSYLDPLHAQDTQQWITEALNDTLNPLNYILWITQSPQEMLTLADRLSILEKGKILTSDTPESIYTTPPSLVTAKLTGSITTVDSQTWQNLKKFTHLSAGEIHLKPDELIAFRPEWCDLQKAPSDSSSFRIHKTRFTPYGYFSQIIIKDTNVPPISIHTTNRPDHTQLYQLTIKHAPLIFSQP